MNSNECISTTIPQYAVQLVAERQLAGPIINGPAGVAQFAVDFLKRADREHFIVILLATSGRVIGVHVAHVGSISASIVRPADVYKAAVLGNAASVVVAHNHPSGTTEPSQEDISVTRQLAEAGRIMGIRLLDHLIVTPGREFTSLAERGVL